MPGALEIGDVARHDRNATDQHHGGNRAVAVRLEGGSKKRTMVTVGLVRKDETVLAGELRRLAPSAVFDPLIVTHANFLLGRMSAAVHAIDRGAEARECVPFRIGIKG